MWRDGETPDLRSERRSSMREYRNMASPSKAAYSERKRQKSTFILTVNSPVYPPIQGKENRLFLRPFIAAKETGGLDFLIAHALLIVCHSLFEVVIHYVEERGKVVILRFVAVHAVIDCDKAYLLLGEQYLGIKADFKIVSAETAHILDDNRADFSSFGFCKHCLKSGTVEVTPCVTVIGKMLDVHHIAFASKIFEKSLLIQYRVRFAMLLIILGQPFIEGCNSIKIPDFRHFLTSFPAFIRSHIQWTACNIYPKTSFPFEAGLQNLPAKISGKIWAKLPAKDVTVDITIIG